MKQKSSNMIFILSKDIVDEDPSFISLGLLGKTYTFGEGEEAREIYIKGRVAFVLERMELLGFITEEERQEAQLEADSIEFTPFRDEIEAPHFCDVCEANFRRKNMAKSK